MTPLHGWARERSPLIVSAIAVLAIHGPILGRYAIHRDEMYFVECGRRLATGYVDHPPETVERVGFDQRRAVIQGCRNRGGAGPQPSPDQADAKSKRFGIAR